MITVKTATDIALAYREIETAEKLLAEIDEVVKNDRFQPADIRDAFGRPQRGLQLGVPSGENSHRLFNVPWALARPVINAHIAAKRAEMEALQIAAASELSSLSSQGPI